MLAFDLHLLPAVIVWQNDQGGPALNYWYFTNTPLQESTYYYVLTDLGVVKKSIWPIYEWRHLVLFFVLLRLTPYGKADFLFVL